MTHVQIPESISTPTGTVPLNGDGIGYVEAYDFSRANLSNESRIATISMVASVCYQSPKAAGSISLYNRLANESAGLPSSSFEFVPVLLEPGDVTSVFNIACGEKIHDYEDLATIKYGEKISHTNLDGDSYLLTNLRALMADVGDKADQFFNTEEECAIIAKHHKVFKSKMDMATSKQFNRHRVSLQELSRRYVSGKKSELEFYISPKMTTATCVDRNEYQNDTQDIVNLCTEHYYKAVANGIKPEEARRILPQCMYTTIWSAWQPSQLESYLTLRCDSHTQIEHQRLAEGMRQLANPSIKPETTT